MVRTEGRACWWFRRKGVAMFKTVAVLTIMMVFPVGLLGSAEGDVGDGSVPYPVEVIEDGSAPYPFPQLEIDLPVPQLVCVPLPPVYVETAVECYVTFRCTDRWGRQPYWGTFKLHYRLFCNRCQWQLCLTPFGPCFPLSEPWTSCRIDSWGAGSLLWCGCYPPGHEGPWHHEEPGN